MPRFTYPKFQVVDKYGNPGVGYKIHFYQTLTTTYKTIYGEIGNITPIANPAIADDNGRFPRIFISGVYNVVLTDADNNVIDATDPVAS